MANLPNSFLKKTRLSFAIHSQCWNMIINILLIRDYWCLQTLSFYVTFANIHLHVTSQHPDVTSTLIAIQFDSLCANCQFLKTGLADHIGVLQTPITIIIMTGYQYDIKETKWAKAKNSDNRTSWWDLRYSFGKLKKRFLR